MDATFVSIALELFKRLDTPRSLTCYILVKNSEWDQLVHLRADPRTYCTDMTTAFGRTQIEQFHRDYQATELLRKCSGLPTGIDTAAVAVSGFYSAEQQCCSTNVRLSRHISYPVFRTGLEWHADRLIGKARKWINSVLGSPPDWITPRLGPGSVFEASLIGGGGNLTAYDKLNQPPAGTSGALEFKDATLRRFPWLHGSWDQSPEGRSSLCVRGNRFAVVPKDATKDRGICIEPGFNVALQLGLGQVLKSRLCRVGIDLTNGQFHHRDLARIGSRDGSNVTIDLSNASDTVSRSLVELLFPKEWYTLLGALRSPFTRIGSKWVYLEKFSSMGNGYTFELETLVFCSLVHACGGNIGVNSFCYGDDIICPSPVAKDVLALLGYCGFTPNVRKTFLDGCFRESCGGDYLLGRDVTPVRVKSIPSSPQDWIGLHNLIYALEERLGIPLTSLRRRCEDRIPVAIRRCRGPRELGDLVLTDETAVPRVRNGIRYYRVWKPVAQRKKLLYLVQRFGKNIYSKPNSRYRSSTSLAVMLFGYPSDGLSPRGVSGYKVGRVALS